MGPLRARCGDASPWMHRSRTCPVVFSSHPDFQTRNSLPTYSSALGYFSLFSILPGPCITPRKGTRGPSGSLFEFRREMNHCFQSFETCQEGAHSHNTTPKLSTTELHDCCENSLQHY